MLLQECVALLSEKFPGSPRVAVLIGIRKEASLPAESVLLYYEELLEEDEANAVRHHHSSFRANCQEVS